MVVLVTAGGENMGTITTTPDGASFLFAPSHPGGDTFLRQLAVRYAHVGADRGVLVPDKSTAADVLAFMAAELNGTNVHAAVVG